MVTAQTSEAELPHIALTIGAVALIETSDQLAPL